MYQRCLGTSELNGLQLTRIHEETHLLEEDHDLSKLGQYLNSKCLASKLVAARRSADRWGLYPSYASMQSQASSQVTTTYAAPPTLTPFPYYDSTESDSHLIGGLSMNTVEHGEAEPFPQEPDEQLKWAVPHQARTGDCIK